jgi:hypothetical protein
LKGIQNRSQQQTRPNKPLSRAPISIVAGAHPNTQNEAPREWTGAISYEFRNIMRNSHKNSHSTKIKMAAILAASHLIDFI